MTKGFVFGKFLPFHQGHEAMIRFARGHCDWLTVLVCCSDRENIPGQLRQQWIESACADITNLDVQCYHYAEAALPNTSVSSRDVSAVWGEIFKELLPDHTLLVTSESYGDFVAEYLQIRHVAFDPEKKQFPVSATAIRHDRFANWRFLPAAVKPHFALKVVLLGTESTGKTTLAELLARHYGATVVPEAARDIIFDSNDFSFEDLQRVAAAQARLLAEAVLQDSPLLIIDTDIHITKSYALHRFGWALDVPAAMASRADLYLYLRNDRAYVQDGTRLHEAERNALDFSHRRVLADHGIDYVEIHGDWAERFRQAVMAIDALIGESKY